MQNQLTQINNFIENEFRIENNVLSNLENLT